MSEPLSPEAQSIIEAAVKAAKAADANHALDAADRAVKRTVAHLGLTDPTQDSRMIDPLIEIAQLHVRQQLSNYR